MFGISGFELLLIMVFILVIFGPDKLPQIGRTLGRAVGTFKKIQQDMEHVIRAEMYTTNKSTPKAAGEAGDADTEGVVTEESPDEASEIWTMTTETDEADDEEDEE